MVQFATMQKNAQGNGQKNGPGLLVPFTRASREHIEPAFDHSVTAAVFGAGPTAIGPFDLPAFGYARSLLVLVEATAGAAGLNNAVSQADGPWDVINEIAILDVNGAPIVGPFSGFDLMLANKWGGYAFDADPTNGPGFVDIATSGNFTILLRVPLEIVQRDALGALPNMNAAATYKVRITVADNADVYSTSPDTLPGLRFRGYLEAWSQPQDADPRGNPQATRPPGVGTTQFWSKATYNIANGSNTIRLARVGNFIRTLICVFRTTAGARDGAAGASVPDPVQVFLDGRTVTNEAMLIRRQIMAERYGYNLTAIATANDDEGVWVYDFTHDFDGHPGGELRDLWLPTVQSSRLEIVGSFGAAGSLDVLTNDVAPVGELV